MSQQQSARFFQCVQRQGTRNCGEACQKIVQTFAALEIIEEGLDWHSGAAKDRDTVHSFGVFDDCVSHASIVAQASDHGLCPGQEG